MRHELVESNRIICQGQVSKNQEASEETTQRYHLPEGQSDRDKEVEWGSRRYPEND